ncbi:MAG: hypothetical protein ACJ76P_06570 [Actinomycetota bacterium]
MVRKIGILATSVSLLAIVIFSVTFAGAASPKIASEETMTLTTKQTNGVLIDLGQRGLSAGDLFEYRSALWSHGEKVGVENGNCSPHFPVSSHHLRFLCSAVSSDIFGRGQILSAGAFTLDVTAGQLRRGTNIFAHAANGSDITFAITGGTHDFENVRGQIHEFSNSSREVYDLLP